LDLDFLVEEFGETSWKNFLFNLIVKYNGSVESFFSLEGGEYRAWSLKFVKQSFVLEVIIDLVINFVKLIPLLILNECISLLKVVDDPLIEESERDLSNLDLLDLAISWPVEAKVIHGRDTLFEFGLDVHLELSHFTHRVVTLMIMALPFVVDFLIDIKLNTVVTSSDGLHIEVNEVVLLHLFDIVEIDDGKHVDEHSKATNHESEDLSGKLV
jgi:hypothetical protein